MNLFMSDPDDDHIERDAMFLDTETGDYVVVESKAGSGKTESFLRRFKAYDIGRLEQKYILVEGASDAKLLGRRFLRLGSSFIRVPHHGTIQVTTPALPTWCDWIFRILMQPKRRLTLLGDLEEGFHEDINKGSKYAFRRYYFEVAMIILRQILELGEWLFRFAK